MSNELLISLIEATIKNNVAEVCFSLEKGADPNGYEDKAKLRPLHYATLYNAYDCAEILITHGANPLAENDDGETPFDLAKLHRREKITHLFLRTQSNHHVN